MLSLQKLLRELSIDLFNIFLAKFKHAETLCLISGTLRIQALLNLVQKLKDDQFSLSVHVFISGGEFDKLLLLRVHLN